MPTDLIYCCLLFFFVPLTWRKLITKIQFYLDSWNFISWRVQYIEMIHLAWVVIRKMFQNQVSAEGYWTGKMETPDLAYSV